MTVVFCNASAKNLGKGAAAMPQNLSTPAARRAARRKAAAKRRKKQRQQRLVLLVCAASLILIAVLLLVNHSSAKKSAPPPSEPAPSTLETTAPSEPTQGAHGSEVLAKYSSPISDGYNRTVNLQLACAAIDGTVVPADGVFSFNETVGERTEEKGYLPADIYAAGMTVAQTGGGICQVASTLYLVALKSDMEIVERHSHQFSVSYVPLGMDASIYYDEDEDFRFKNNSGFPILIHAAVNDGNVDIFIEGTKKNDNYTVMEYEVLATYEPEDVEQINWQEDSDYREVISTPITGYYVQTYRCTYAVDGTLLSKTEEAVSNYFKRDKVTEIGPPKPEENTDCNTAD